MSIFIICVLYLGLFILAEFAKRKLHWKSETTRCCLHVTTGMVSTVLPVFISRNEIILLAVAFTIGLAASHWKNILHSIHGVERAGWGEVFFPIGVGAAAWFLLPAHADGYTYALLNMTFADVFANWAGRTLPGRKIVFHKSVTGSFAFLAVSWIIGLWFFSPLTALWRAGVLALIELFSPRGTDNLTIILISIPLII